MKRIAQTPGAEAGPRSDPSSPAAARGDPGETLTRATRAEGNAGSTSCPICASPRFETVLSAVTDLRVGAVDVYRLDLCTGCQTVRLNPSPTDAQLERAYPDGYYWYNAPGAESVSGKRRVVETLLDILNWSGGYRSLWQPPKSARSLLDVGCGTGDYLAAVRRPGLKVMGVEPSPYAARIARTSGIPIIEAPVETALNGTTETYDVIVLNHVLEHVRDPLALLRLCRSRLNPSGYLQVSVPSFSALGVRLFGANWLPLDAPRHLFQWSPAALRNLLRRGGFKILGQSFQFNPFTYGQSAAAGKWRIQTTSMAGRSAVLVSVTSALFATCAPWAALWPDRMSPYFRTVATPDPGVPQSRSRSRLTL